MLKFQNSSSQIFRNKIKLGYVVIESANSGSFQFITEDLQRERERDVLPDIVSIEAIDENISAEVEEVYSGSSHRHLRSSVWTKKKIDQNKW